MARATLDDVVKSVGDQVNIQKFTMPGGAPAHIVVGKIVDVQRSLQARDHPKSKALITTREGTQQVRESKTKVLQMIGTSIAGRKKVICAMASERQEDLGLLKELVEAGKITTEIDRTFPMERAAEAHRYVEGGHKQGQVVLTIAEA